MSAEPPVEDVTDADIEVTHPKHVAVGLPGILHSMEPALRQLGPKRTAELFTSINQRGGFDCMSCAWPDPDDRKKLEFCENGAKAVIWEATPVVIPSAFWAEHSLTDLADKSEYWLGMQGRLSEPVYKPAGSDHYRPVSWDEAFAIVGEQLRGQESPDEAVFYTSGRASNEAAFVYQLFVRAFGTNNLPDCSNMCHESTGTALGEVIGVGKSTIRYEDFEQADLIIVMGQNPGTNHPRMLTALEDAKQAGATIVSVNPLPEAALERYKNPQTVRGMVGRGTVISDQFLQIRLGGDMALLQAVSKRVLEAEAAAPGTILDHAFLAEHCLGLEELTAHLADLDEAAVLEATGLTSEQIDELAERYIASNATIVTWAMGLTQHKAAVNGIKEIINLLLLRGNIGKPGAGASPIRGHSNVQGDRTMGIWEQMPESFLDRHGARVRGPDATGARGRRGERDPSDAAGRGPHLDLARRQLHRGDLRHRRRRGRDPRNAAVRADLHEAQPVARRHGRGCDHPADPRAHRDRPPGERTADGQRRGLGVRRPRLARPHPAGSARSPLRGRHHHPTRACDAR